MSISALKWASEQTAGTPGAKLVLLILADFADSNGIAYPSQATIADVSEQGVRTVRDHLLELERRTLIARTRRHRDDGTRTSNAYQLRLPAKPAGNEPPAKFAASERLPAKPAAGTTGEKQQDYRQISPGSGTSGTLEPSVNRKDERTADALQKREQNFNREFEEEFWPRYPKRKGNRAKKAALSSYRARRREGIPKQKILDAVKRLHRFHEVKGDLGSQYVMRASTFLNDPDNFDNPWTPPTREEQPGRHDPHPESEAAQIKRAGPTAEAPKADGPRQGTPSNGNSRDPAPEKIQAAREWASENPEEAERIWGSVERSMGDFYQTLRERNEERAQEAALKVFTNRLLHEGILSANGNGAAYAPHQVAAG